ncbi:MULTISPECIES: Rrf2 family transcriptional regulator [Corallincola]|uniref:Rrf2 family transcriptional regulator n=3 Tax=Corallincola TaxID=1775176 RepID=A0A368NJN2_9GAMM|nr:MULTISPECIES: Rrf2 family transcriptional regulator [Corallincola]RCU50817.1 Rrf2 family transcriptional regulator [Corallincola holothuriorum]TAA45775.1 Rrf2 family transcriptional regulator [Corallincola spongiicola]TCI03873.1 Rrf2 family transcriptional regulator [Corallincola luteus]
MRLTTYTDFGLRTLIYLALLPADKQTSIAKVSAHYQVSRNHMVKVIHKLATLGYVSSTRGKGGGIKLGLAAEEVCIGDVVRALESALDGIDCQSPACCLTPACRLKFALTRAVDAFLEVLDQYTLADLVENKDDLIPLLWQDGLPE